MIALILFILVLGFLVVVHELGHFWAARVSKVKVTEFGVGLPPKAYGYQPAGSEVEYSLNWLPIGGFVKIFGENYDTLDHDDPDYSRSFINATKLRQIFILSAGVLMNFLAAILLFTLSGLSGSLVPTEDIASRDGFYVIAVSADSPAGQANLAPGTEIISIQAGDQLVSGMELTSQAFSEAISESTDNVVLKIKEGQAERELDITPTTGIISADTDRRAIGVYADSLALERYGLIESVIYGVQESISSLRAIVTGFGQLITGAVTGSGKDILATLAGPVGIAQMSEQALQVGLGTLFSFAAILSLNLVVLNLLPIPALDGGRILFVIIEAIKGSPLNSKVAGYANLAGFALLILLMISVTIQDIIRLF